MNYRPFIAAVGSLLFLTAASAHAGVITLEPILSISEEYTDNRNLTATDLQEEFITIVSAGLNQTITGKRGGSNASYTAGHVTYHEAEDEDATWRHNAALSFWADLSKHTTWTLQGGYVRTDENLQRDRSVFQEDTSPIEKDTTVRNGRNLYETGSASTNLTYQFREQDTLSFNYLYSTRRELELEDGNDNERHSPAVNVTWWPNSLFGMDYSVSYTNAKFDNADDYEEWQGGVTLYKKTTQHIELFFSYDQIAHRYETRSQEDYNEYAPSIGVAYQIEDDISLSVGEGYFIQDMKGGEDEEGFYLDASINKVWSSPRGNSRLSGSAGLDRNDFGTENLGLDRYYGIDFSASYRLTMHFQVGINTAYRRNEYLNTSDDRKDDQFQGGCDLTLTPSTSISIQASYSHNLLRSTIEEKDYNENVGLLTVTIAPRGHRYDY